MASSSRRVMENNDACGWKSGVVQCLTDWQCQRKQNIPRLNSQSHLEAVDPDVGIKDIDVMTVLKSASYSLHTPLIPQDWALANTGPATS